MHSTANPVTCAGCGHQIALPGTIQLVADRSYHPDCAPGSVSIREARAFVEFVLRHTWPDRAKEHGFDTVHSLILHHPFSQEHGPKQAAAPGDDA